jgi:hypothetical protein
VTVDSSTVSANTAANNGGGIFNQLTLNVQNGSTVSANTAITYDGGGIFNEATTTVDDSTVSGNTTNSDGGGIYNELTLNVQNGSTIGGAGAGNQATNGGGISTSFSGITRVTDSRILYNRATGDGGGVLIDVTAGATSLTDSCIVGNSATSFLNNWAAQQTATGNWWGAATGPNTPGADTVGGNVDTSGFLTAPILGCPANYPDLQVNKANDTGGNGAVGMAFNWTLTVANPGVASALFTAGQRILEDDLPSGPSYGAPVPGNFINITNTANIICTIAANTLTCDAAGADVTIGATTGSFDVVLSVTPNAAELLSNPAGTCRVDPDDNVVESDESNNDCPADNVNVAAPDLQVDKANDTGGTGTVGTAFNWTLTVSNPGVASALFTAGQRILEDDLPAGPTYGAPAPGNFINITNTANIICTIAANTLTCDAAGADVTIGATTGSFDVVLSVTPNAAGILNNPRGVGTCRVDPNDNVVETDEGNNDCPADSVGVAAPDLQVLKANDTGGSGTVGTAFNWTLTVANIGSVDAVFTAGQRILEDDLPAGPTYGAPVPGNFANITNTANIICTIAANTLTCDAAGADVTIGAATGSFDVVLSVTPNAAELLSNPAGNCRVDPDDNVVETDEGNNDCPADSVGVAAPDLQVLKANDTGGSGTVGTAFNWTLTVANIGGVDATFSDGQRILEDDLPAGPTYGAPVPGNFINIANTANIICTIAANTLTCDAAGADVTIGATTGSFDIVLSVTPNAAGILNNPRGVGTCRVDPNDNMVESDESNNDCANAVNVAALAPTPSPPDGGDDDDDEPASPPPPTPIRAPKAQEFNCWPWLVIVPLGAAPNAVPGEWCQASLGQPLPVVSTFRYLGHSTDVTVKDAAGMVITSFARPIKVCFHYTQPELGAVGGDPASFLIQVFRNGKWEALDTKPEGSLSHPGVCAPVDHLTLFALFVRDGATRDASAAAASDNELLFPTHLPETGERPLGSGGWGLLVAGVAILTMGVSAWLLRCR